MVLSIQEMQHLLVFSSESLAATVVSNVPTLHLQAAASSHSSSTSASDEGKLVTTGVH